MCLAYPGTVKKIEGLEATVDYVTSTRRALIGEKKVKVGDKVMVQMGIIVQIISDKEAKTIKKAWDEVEKNN
ncbi:MAG: HypC/HybG/HupF family hydrogenase formation chaperone [Candidatus Shapirobacteria bacterium]